MLVAAGMPPDFVWLSAMSGALLSLWRAPRADTTLAWLISALGRIGLSIALGVAGAAALPPVLAGYDMLRPLASVPAPVWALLCSLFAPSIYRVGELWLDARIRPASQYAAQAAQAQANQQENRHG